jgi:hypothetical protein
MEKSRGFQIRGLNGYTLSIGVGGGHYCDNYDLGWDDDFPATETMEVAIINEETHKFVCLSMDVAGYVPVSNLSLLIQSVRNGDWDEVRDLCGETVPPFEKHPMYEESPKSK